MNYVTKPLNTEILCKKFSISELRDKKEQMIGHYSDTNQLWYHNPEFCPDRMVYANAAIFQLKELPFEGYMFKNPNDYNKYLMEIYGDYMSMPKSGVLHHKGRKGDKGITYNVVKFNTYLETVTKELKSYS